MTRRALGTVVLALATILGWVIIAAFLLTSSFPHSVVDGLLLVHAGCLGLQLGASQGLLRNQGKSNLAKVVITLALLAVFGILLLGLSFEFSGKSHVFSTLMSLYAAACYLLAQPLALLTLWGEFRSDEDFALIATYSHKLGEMEDAEIRARQRAERIAADALNSARRQTR
jgi:hypothetical protein